MIHPFRRERVEPFSSPKNISNNVPARWNCQNEQNETLDPILLPRYIHPVSTHFDTRILKFNHCQSSSRRERAKRGRGADKSVHPPWDIPADKVALDWISRCRLYGRQQCVTRCAINARTRYKVVILRIRQTRRDVEWKERGPRRIRQFLSGWKRWTRNERGPMAWHALKISPRDEFIKGEFYNTQNEWIISMSPFLVWVADAPKNEKRGRRETKERKRKGRKTKRSSCEGNRDGPRDTDK